MANPSSGWPASDDLAQYLPDNERRISSLERRTRIPKASQILGPGLAPWAVQVWDWNDDKTLYNGIFYSETGSLNSPNPAKAWIGSSYAINDGRGLQEVAEIGTSGDEETWERGFTATPGGTRTFGIWVKKWPIDPEPEPQWQTYSPTIAGGSMGPLGILDGRYIALTAKEIHFEIRVAPGSGYSLDGNTVFGIPLGTVSNYGLPYLQDLNVRWVDAGNNWFMWTGAMWASGVSAYPMNSALAPISTWPAAFNAGDYVFIKGSYVRN